jgi:hypothetical protein
MLGPEDCEEVNADGNDVVVANVRAMLRHFKGDDELSKEFMKSNALLYYSKEELCSICKKEHTKLTSILELLRFEAECGLSDRSFTKMLSIFKDVLPDGNEFLESMTTVKKIISALGLEVQNIDACIKNCILYHFRHSNTRPGHGSPSYMA